MTRPLFLVPLALALVGWPSCNPPPSPIGPEPPPRPTADAAPAPVPSPSPRDASPPPASVLDACERACAAMAAIPCPEGKDKLCVGRCEAVEQEHLTGLHPECLALAKTKAAARLCSSSISCK